MPEENFGYLTVNVFTAGGALPIEGAMITIKKEDGENSDVVAVLYTDRSGVSGKIRLPAPPSSNAETPGGGIPYAFYNIDTDKTGYYSTYNVFVPIYSNVTAVQPVELIPVARRDDGTVYPYDMSRYNEGFVPNL